MSRFNLVFIALAVALTSFEAAAQTGADADTSKSSEVKASPSADAAAPKRGISEEGGMKASGPSQAKDGESR